MPSLELEKKVEGQMGKNKLLVAAFMKVLYILLAYLLIAAIFESSALAIEKAARITDREIIESLAELKEGQRALNQRINDIRDLIYIVIAGIFGLIVIVIWDRRTAISPVIRKNRELEEREELLERALKEYAKKEPDLAEVLKSLKLM